MRSMICYGVIYLRFQLQRGDEAGTHERGVCLPEQDQLAQAHPSPLRRQPHHTALRPLRFASSPQCGFLGPQRFVSFDMHGLFLQNRFCSRSPRLWHTTLKLACCCSISQSSHSGSVIGNYIRAIRSFC
jgi:hypothetical protein